MPRKDPKRSDRKGARLGEVSRLSRFVGTALRAATGKSPFSPCRVGGIIGERGEGRGKTNVRKKWLWVGGKVNDSVS